jgi:hypothetical protein
VTAIFGVLFYICLLTRGGVVEMDAGFVEELEEGFREAWGV